MLGVLFGDREEFIKEHNILRGYEAYLETYFERSWLDEDWIRRELVMVERFPVGKDPMQELFDRGLTYLQLCGGTQTLLLARHIDWLIDFARMGSNCYPYLMEIADMQDVRVAIERVYPEYDDTVIKGRTILIENNGVVVATEAELFDVGVKYLYA